MADLSRAAAAEAARRKVKRANGLLREAAHDLAAAAEGPTVLGVVVAHDDVTVASAVELMELGVSRHGRVTVVVMVSPSGHRSPPTTAPEGAKESRNGNHHEGQGHVEGRRGRP